MIIMMMMMTKEAEACVLTCVIVEPSVPQTVTRCTFKHSNISQTKSIYSKVMNAKMVKKDNIIFPLVRTPLHAARSTPVPVTPTTPITVIAARVTWPPIRIRRRRAQTPSHPDD